MDRLKLQLEQKKTQLALLQEKKAENELQLKKEKKSLLENFIKVREENKKIVAIYQQFMNGHSNFMDQSAPNINENNYIIQNFDDEQQEDLMPQDFNESQNFENVNNYTGVNNNNYPHHFLDTASNQKMLNTAGQVFN